MLAASLTTPWESNSRDAIDNAILNSLRHYPQAREQLIRHKLLDFEPFSPETKQIWSLVEDADGEHLTCTRGAPKACLETWLADNMDHPNKADVVEQYREACKSLATSGLQCLGILRKHENEQWQLMGILPLDDPIRWNAASAIRYANELGIQVKAMTGHTEVIAQEIALKVGLNDQVLSLEGFHGKHANDATADSSMNVAIGGATYFCSVSPDDKVKICRTLQETGILIAMTGDGVSDAPCLRLAHCGIAVEGASERAQAAANVVFLEPGISAHVAAISAARRYFRLMETFLTHRSAFSIGLIVLVFLFYHKFGEYLDPEYLFSIFCLEDLVQAVYLQEPEHDDAPIEKKPTRLRLEKVWSLSGPLCIAVVGMMITVLELFERPSTARKILYLPIICASHWSFLFVYTRGHYQFYSRLWRAFSPLLGSQIAACLFHGFVWRSESGPLSLVTVSGERLAIASSLATIWQCWLIWRN
jgi:H+-transporting ATPase